MSNNEAIFSFLEEINKKREFQQAGTADLNFNIYYRIDRKELFDNQSSAKLFNRTNYFALEIYDMPKNLKSLFTTSECTFIFKNQTLKITHNNPKNQSERYNITIY